MKLLNLVTPGVFIALALAPAHAEDNNGIRIHVPFSFIAAGKAMPAGDYVVQEVNDSGLLMVHGRGESNSVALLTRSADAKAKDLPGAKFISIDGQKYLDQVELTDGTARAALSHLPK